MYEAFTITGLLVTTSDDDAVVKSVMDPEPSVILHLENVTPAGTVATIEYVPLNTLVI